MIPSMRTAKTFVGSLVFSGVAMLSLRASAQDSALPSMLQTHLDNAKLLMGTNPNLQGMQTLCIDLKEWGKFRQDNTAHQQVLPPTKVFDQLYYIGMSSVGSWALVTSDGIIQIDTLHNSEEAERIIVGGYKKLGLDPTKIKYVILTHSHAEHYGGGKYFQDTFHSHVLMAGPDWDVIAKAPNPPPATRDMVVTDGQKLTLGNTTITMFVAPGHTPGTIDLLIPVTDHGQPHLMSFVGGTGIPRGMDSLIQYQTGFERFMKIGEDEHVDGTISNHPWFDNTYTDGKTDKMTKAASRKPGDPNPWVVGQGEYVLSMMANLECLESSMARLKEKGEQ
jgi:metallo-beta-lactamase class B